jgi:glucosamine-6-phosphate deaminase
MKLIETKDYDEMSRKAAGILAAQVVLKPRCVLGLATGSTPLGVYRQLIEWYKEGILDFSEIKTVNLDEYCGLAPENDQSYHYYMHHNFFDSVNIRPENIHLPDGRAEDADAACKAYDRMIDSLGGIDLQLLGLGGTGHIGFNEPSQSFDRGTHRVALKEKTIRDNSRFFESINDVPKYAITMGIGTIMKAKEIVLVVNGPKKADILEKVLFGPITPEVPASVLQLHRNVTVLADREALLKVHELHSEV